MTNLNIISENYFEITSEKCCNCQKDTPRKPKNQKKLLLFASGVEAHVWCKPSAQRRITFGAIFTKTEILDRR